jgi:hypothetical protein|tara:strand:+ start:1094 stop:1477 length:384 start_codon:yes stop_codon:yes gene_type:complete
MSEEEIKRLSRELESLKGKIDTFSENMMRLQFDNRKVSEAVPQLKEVIQDIYVSINGVAGDIGKPGVSGHLRSLLTSVESLESQAKEQSKLNTEQRQLNLKLYAAVTGISAVAGGGGAALVKFFTTQ